ncbi:MAG: hypothetical protein EXS18_03055 [Verrucomicrobiae bacterium]|nr:hypothetical protein [Verrucomicrobiae bacterium]
MIQKPVASSVNDTTQAFLVDVLDVRTEKETQIDWFAHAVSDKVTLLDNLTGKPKPPGSANGYQHLSDGVLYEAKGSTRWSFIADKSSLGVWFSNSQPEQIFTVTGIGYYVEQKVPCLIRRRHARETRFVTVYDLSGNGGGIKGLHSSKDTAEVETPQGKWSVRFATDGVVVQLPK